MKYIENYYKKQQDGQLGQGTPPSSSMAPLSDPNRDDRAPASNLQDDVSPNRVQDETAVPETPSSKGTTAMGQTKRTGEDNWADNEIADEAYFDERSNNAQ